MTKQQKKEFDNLYKFNNQEPTFNNIEEQEKINKKKGKEREKRIKQKKVEEKTQFDFDTETVIGMTNRNNQVKKQQTQKRMTKKQAQIERKKKKIKRIIKWTTLFLLIIGGIVFALVSPVFNIKEIQVINNSQIATETIVSLSQLQVGQNSFRFNKNKVVKEIKTNPYVESVDIKRKFPNKIEISIEERNRNYNVEFLNGYAYINNQGYILEISEQKLDLPVIIGISTEQEQIVEGNRLNTDDLEKLETVIKIMNICKNYDLDTKISSIYISNKNDYIIYMEEEKKTIYLGDDSNLSNKMLYVPTILQENQGKEGTIYLNGDINNNFKPRFREKV
mgnify:CR=1 FL=1